MIQKIDACLKERGYSFIKVSPEEVGVYYRFTEGRAQVVACLLYTSDAADDS